MKSKITVAHVIAELTEHYNKRNIEGMARFGIDVTKAFGLNAPTIKAIAKKLGTNHELALDLWESGYHEARIIAFLIDDPQLVSKSQMNKWVRDFNS